MGLHLHMPGVIIRWTGEQVGIEVADKSGDGTAINVAV